MADPIEKFLAKVTKEEREQITDLIERIISGDFIGLNRKKLSGSDDIFRIRKGKFRIVYKEEKLDKTIIFIGRRSEKTYRSF